MCHMMFIIHKASWSLPYLKSDYSLWCVAISVLKKRFFWNASEKNEKTVFFYGKIVFFFGKIG